MILKQLVCQFQDAYFCHKGYFGFVEISNHITLKPDAELKKQFTTKVLYVNAERKQKQSDEIKKTGKIYCVGLDAAKKQIEL